MRNRHSTLAVGLLLAELTFEIMGSQGFVKQ